MRTSSLAACVLLLAPGVRAQLTVSGFASAPAAMAAPAALSASAAAATAVPALFAPALALPAFAAAPSVLAAAPALNLVSAPVPAAAPALAAASFAAAAAAPEKAQTPGAARAAAALSEFSRLVGELMGGDASKSAAASAALNKIKEAHLNASPDPKSTKILDLKPMQIPVGMIEVDAKAKALKDLKDKKADEWLRKKSAPIVEDFKGRKRPVDHHHELHAAWMDGFKSAYSHRYFDDKLHDLLKGLTKEQFYAVTRAMGLYYDRDEHGVVREPGALPADTRGHTDDPYRSLAGSVRDAGGYDKTSEPFAEFQWANYFRARVKIGPTRQDFDKAVAEGAALVHDPAAKGLPGYKPQ